VFCANNSLSSSASPLGFVLGENPHSVVEAAAPIELTEEEQLGEEFDQVILKWLALNIDWLVEFPELRKLGKANNKLDLLSDLMQLDIGPLYEKFCTPLQGLQGECMQYGLLPFMALANLGSDLAASYVERVNSAAKDVMPDGSTLLNDLPLEMFTILRMNADFIDYFVHLYS
jgi:hypothetical protein